MAGFCENHICFKKEEEIPLITDHKTSQVVDQK